MHADQVSNFGVHVQSSMHHGGTHMPDRPPEYTPRQVAMSLPLHAYACTGQVAIDGAVSYRAIASPRGDIQRELRHPPSSSYICLFDDCLIGMPIRKWHTRNDRDGD